MLDVIEFHNRIPGASVDARVKFGDTASVSATLTFDTDSHLTIGTSEKRSDPREIAKLRSSTGTLPHPIKFRFSGKRGRRIKARRPECALLRIAYLMAFAQFGYAFILPKPISIVREQIRSPGALILPSWGISQDNRLPDSLLGINLITKPKEIRSFGIAFDLVTSLQSYRYLALLPGPAKDCHRIYDKLTTEEFTSIGQTLEFRHIPNIPGVFADPELALASHWIWKNM